jgi:hypothetical protein
MIGTHKVDIHFSNNAQYNINNPQMTLIIMNIRLMRNLQVIIKILIPMKKMKKKIHSK